MRIGWQQNEHECEEFFWASANFMYGSNWFSAFLIPVTSPNGFQFSIYEDYMFDGIIASFRFEFIRTTGRGAFGG
jgi:hypothetical protein